MSNFFTNLGIGKIALIEKWVNDFKTKLNYAQATSLKVQNKKVVISPYCNVADTINKILSITYNIIKTTAFLAVQVILILRT